MKSGARYKKSLKYQGVYYDELKNGDITYHITYKVVGKKLWQKIGRKSNGFSERDAYLKRAAILNEVSESLDRGERLPSSVIKKLERGRTYTVDMAANEFFDDKAITNRNNAKSKNRYLKNISPLIGGYELGQLRYIDILELRKALLADGKANATVNWELAQVKAIINYAIKRSRYRGENPFKEMEPLNVANNRERYLSSEEVETLLKAITGDQDLELFLLLSLSTGARLGAVMQLEWRDIDLKNDIITIIDQKNADETYKGFINSSLKIFLTSIASQYKPTDKLIQCSERSIQRNLQFILNALFNESLAKNDRRKRVVIHTLRHSFASNLAINGTSIYQIQKLMNHKSIEQTERYAKLSPDSGKDAVKNLWKNKV